MIKSKFNRFDFDRKSIIKIENSVGTAAALRKKALQINGVAKVIFLSQVRHTHPVTPPAYAGSFKIRKALRGAKLAYHAYNDDPAAFWVEFGAYIRHLTHPRILKYKPLTRALDVVSGGDF